MKDYKLVEFIEDHLSWELANYGDINISGIASDLTYGIENNGYCSYPYFEYEKALCCPINKRREKNCSMTSCPSNDFCKLLRREGYIS